MSSWGVGSDRRGPLEEQLPRLTHCLGALRWPCILQGEVMFPHGGTQGMHTWKAEVGIMELDQARKLFR